MRRRADEGIEDDDADDCDDEPAIDTAEPVDLECPYGGAVSFNVILPFPAAAYIGAGGEDLRAAATGRTLCVGWLKKRRRHRQ